MLPKKAEYFDQMTIVTPIKPNKFPSWAISKWLIRNKEIYLSDRPSDKIFKFDSLTIDNKKFGVFGIKTMDLETKVIYMTNINNESIEFEFYTNLQPKDSFYLKSLNLMKTIKIKTLPLTAVSRNGEKCAKFTFFFRKNFYLTGKYAVTKFATS